MVVVKSLDYKMRQLRGISVKHKFTQKQWEKKLGESGGYCAECGAYVGIKKLTLDHQPHLSDVEDGFIYTIDNVRPICRPCNQAAGSKMKRTATQRDFKRLNLVVPLAEYKKLQKLKVQLGGITNSEVVKLLISEYEARK